MHNYQQLSLKNKLSKQNEQNNRYGDNLEGYQLGEGRGEWGKGAWIKCNLVGTINIDRGMLRTVGNGEAKELICMTHGHELREGIAGGNGGTG